MSTLAERIAAKRAAASAPAQTEAPTEAKQEPVQAEDAAKALTFAEKLALKRGVPAAPAPVAEQKVEAQEEVGPLGAATEEPSKPLSFAEKLALKKTAIAAAGSSPMAQTAAKPVREFYMDPERLPDDPETAQGLMDISKRIFDLEELIDDDLARSMSELKDALRKNPAAAELILDEDVGKMVSSLRRMRHLSVTAATKEKKSAGTKTKPKAKDVALTADEIAKAFDEL